MERIVLGKTGIEVSRLAQGTGFTGGNQSRLTQVVAGTKLGDALFLAHDRGAVIAGTSAGVIMFTALAGAVGAMVLLRRSDTVFMLVVVWAAYGIAAKQAATPAVAGAASTLCLLGLILIVLTQVIRTKPALSGHR